MKIILVMSLILERKIKKDINEKNKRLLALFNKISSLDKIKIQELLDNLKIYINQ